MEREDLRKALKSKIHSLQKERLSEHGQSVQETKMQEYKNEQERLLKEKQEIEDLKKQKKRQKEKEKKKRQKERKKEKIENDKIE
tara:strand:- start:515 stop:769 length:255 start_codon:yes stop_codon:yes gene_type:complete